MKDDELIQQAIDLVYDTGQYPHESVVIFGASFNPITQGHLAFIRALLDDPILQDQRIYLIPARQSPLKSPEMYASATDRLNMLMLALEHHFEQVDRERLLIQTLEIDRPGPSRMSVTLALLTLKHQAQQRYTLVCGYDHLACFQQWYQWPAFKYLAALIFYPREGISILGAESLASLGQLTQAGINVTIVCVDKTQMRSGARVCKAARWIYNQKARIAPSCATDIRAYYQACSGDPQAAIPKGVTPEVHDYILNHACYSR
jgi:nicotinate (nicotinamide) nucleotide adenylyltransferase